jgi:hypothetical protein
VSWTESIRKSALLVALASAVACYGHTVNINGDPGPSPSGDSSVGNYCPTTLAETNGVPCSDEGLQCVQEFDCEGETLSVSCMCKSSRFECQDPIGLLPPGRSPRCISNDPPKYYCPASMDLAEGLSCDELGEACYYEGAVCADGLTKLNYCECEADGHGGHTFGCHILECENLTDGGAEGGDF